MKEHPWFEGIDWVKVEAKEVAPPFIPKTSSKIDTQNVDEDFLNELPSETPVQDCEFLNPNR